MKRVLAMAFAATASVYSQAGVLDQPWQLWQDLVRQELEAEPRTKGGFRNPDNMPAPAPAPAAAVPVARAMVGVTVWKLRPSLPSDPAGPRLKEIVHGPSTRPASEQTPARIGLDAQISGADQIVLAVSATRTGYLYIWSREKFENGVIGPAKLIFPTSRLRGGNNRIQAGRSLRIPDMSDDPPVFELRRKPGQRTEEILVVVAPQPIAGVNESNAIPAAKIAEWQKQWSSIIRQIDAREQKPMTSSELAALSGVDGHAIRPQRLYELRSSPGANIMVAVPLSLVD